MAKTKKETKAVHHPGCSPQKIKMYYDIVDQMKGINVWEHCRPYDVRGEPLTNKTTTIREDKKRKQLQVKYTLSDSQR